VQRVAVAGHLREQLDVAGGYRARLTGDLSDLHGATAFHTWLPKRRVSVVDQIGTVTRTCW
jgi:hypothetical protein